MPNWMSPKRTTSSTGSTRVNSTIVCPRSSLVCVRLVMWSSICSDGIGPESRTRSRGFLSGKEAYDPPEDRLDRSRHRREGRDDGQRDDSEDDDVLRHRLSVFTCEPLDRARQLSPSGRFLLLGLELADHGVQGTVDAPGEKDQ